MPTRLLEGATNANFLLTYNRIFIFIKDNIQTLLDFEHTLIEEIFIDNIYTE